MGAQAMILSSKAFEIGEKESRLSINSLISLEVNCRGLTAGSCGMSTLDVDLQCGQANWPNSKSTFFLS